MAELFMSANTHVCVCDRARSRAYISLLPYKNLYDQVFHIVNVIK